MYLIVVRFKNQDAAVMCNVQVSYLLLPKRGLKLFTAWNINIPASIDNWQSLEANQSASDSILPAVHLWLKPSTTSVNRPPIPDSGHEPSSGGFHVGIVVSDRRTRGSRESREGRPPRYILSSASRWRWRKRRKKKKKRRRRRWEPGRGWKREREREKGRLGLRFIISSVGKQAC